MNRQTNRCDTNATALTATYYCIMMRTGFRELTITIRGADNDNEDDDDYHYLKKEKNNNKKITKKKNQRN